MNNPNFHVLVDNIATSQSQGEVFCGIGSDIDFDSTVLETYCSSRFITIVQDFMVVAAAVEFCDRVKKRPKTWNRKFDLRVAVDEYAHWSDPKVLDPLHKCLSFLTGDEWRIQFHKRSDTYPKIGQDPLGLPSIAQYVMAFSDGLDSRSVAGLIGSPIGKDSIIKVRIGNKGNNIKDKRAFAAIPFTIKEAQKFRESSFRTRGFKFAAISAIAAYLSKVNTILVPESGQGALSPVLLPLHLQYPDYRNHPSFFRLMETFVYSLLDFNIQYSQPRLWSTKGNTINAALRVGVAASDLLDTRSCWQKRHFVSINGKQLQCGVCAACLLRRFSLYHAGLSEEDSVYAVSNFNNPSFEMSAPDKLTENKVATMKAHAVTGVLHFDELSNIDSTWESHVLDAHALEISNATGAEFELTRKRLVNLLLEHKTEWNNFLCSLSQNSFLRKWTSGVEQ